MYECVSIGYTVRMALKTKDVGFRLRVERQLRNEFVELCRAEGRPAAQVLREFMKQYVAGARSLSQQDLFAVPADTQNAG